MGPGTHRWVAFCRNMPVDYGSGIFLDENFDITVDVKSGDIKYEEGVGEVFKDTAFRLSGALRFGTDVSTPETLQDGLVGKVMGTGILRDTETLVGKVLQDDDRIDNVVSVEAEQDSNDPGTVAIEATVELVEDDTTSFEYIISVTE